MLWPPWETVPECSPQIQAWDYLGGYYIRCRGNFRDSNFQNHLASAGPTTCCHCLRRVHLYTGTPVRASLWPKKLRVHRWLCTRVYGRSRLDSGYAAFCSSSCSASSSSSTAPSNRSPLMKKLGVPFTPLRTPPEKSVFTFSKNAPLS